MKDIFESKDALSRWVTESFSDQLDVFRQMNEQIIWRNLLYYSGEQYIQFMPSSKSFKRRIIPDFIPTPVSNEIREFVRSVKAMLMNQKMVPRVWPNTNEKEDIQAADLGENLLTWMDQSNDASFFDEKEKLCIWLCLSGTAFMRTFPDADGGVWMPDGRKTGDVASECILPFNVRVDELGDNMKRKRWVGVQTLKDKEWVEDTFKTKIEATDNKAYVDYQKSLAKLVANVSPWKGVSLTNQALESDDSDMVLFREVEFAPQRKFPEGRYVVQCGNKILQISNRLPIQTVDNQWNYTLTDFHYNYVPGRFWSDAPVSDLISPQNIINEIDQALSINRKGMGRPKVITPGDVGLKLIGIGGHGFVSLSYNPIMGAKPSFEQGTPLPQQVLEERLLQKQQIQDMSGDPKNVLKGQQPSANASGVLTDILRETAERGKYPDIDRFNRSLTRVYKKRILLAQEIMTEERLLKVTGKGNKVKIMKFKASDLRGNTDVRLELDSGLIATKSGQAQMLLNMIQSGFFQDDTVSPTVRQEVFQRMGMTSFSDETNVDVERAEEENSALASGSQDVMTFTQDPETGEPVPVTDDPLFAIDIHPVHYEVHRKYILSPEFKELPVEFQAVAVKHAEAHQMQMESAPPDIREFVQYDKLLPLLKPSGRAMLLAQMGIVEDPSETEAGVPTSDVVVKSKEKIMQTELKEANKMKQFQVTAAQKNREMNIDLLKHGMTEGNKERALQQSKSSGTGK